MNENNVKVKKLVNFGPSGRAIAQPIDKNLLDNIFEHLTMERYASVQYFSIYLWFQERDLNGFASYFLNESKGEMEHAQKFADYLIARGQSVKLDELPAPVQTWDSIEDLISYSFNMEADLTSSLQQLYSISERISDTRTNVFLDPIVEAQTKSEDEFANILGKVKFASNQPSAILLIDSDLKIK
jgi:ferritin